MDSATTKDTVYEQALNQFGKKLDRRLKLSDLSDQLERLEREAENPTPKPKARKPRIVRNVVTGNVMEYIDGWAGNPNLEVIEWEDDDGDT